MSEQPTETQTKKFWEGYGFRHKDDYVRAGHIITEGYWSSPDSSYSSRYEPPIDLNNLFKYAVPKLQAQVKGLVLSLSDSCSQPEYHAEIYGEYSRGEKLLVHKTNADPALALFWALDKARNDKVS